MSTVGPLQQPANAQYGAAAANWAYQQGKKDPASLAVSHVKLARTDSEAQYHQDTFAYAQQDIKNFGGKHGTLTEKQTEKIFGDKTTGDKMFKALDTDKDGKINTAEMQAYVELQDDPTIVKGTDKAVDSYLDGVQQSQKQQDPNMPDMKRDGVATSAERTAADGMILNAPTISSEALKQLRDRAASHGGQAGGSDPSQQGTPFTPQSKL